MKVDRSRFRAPFRRKLLAGLVAACYSSVYAAPVAPSVVAGQASFNQQGNLFTITNTPNTIINWQSFSINANEVTRFVQQNADSKVLNRITGQDPSQILGALQSNGKVFLINPNGVMFGKDSRVDVNGLVASSLAISNADFLAGKNNFSGAAGAGKVSNQGTITTPAGGQVFLIAPTVENTGLINAPNGDVLLAAGQSVQLVDSSNPDVHVVVSAPADAALNLGQIVAQGGRVGIYGALVNQRGTVNANSAVRGENGNIILKASGTTMLEAGSRTTATNTADGGKGGTIQLLGAQVGLTGDATVDASGNAGGGTVLAGGDYQGKNASVQNARQVYVGKDSIIKADAGVHGDGGKVVVWSDETTRMYGGISARGGAAGGNGGFVETSGHALDMQGRVDTRAPHGSTGQLLLDPSNVYIANTVATATAAGMEGDNQIPGSGGVFLETGYWVDSLLTTATLQSALATTDVTVSTINDVTRGGTGFIKVLSPLNWSSAHGLTLLATTNIDVNAAINASGGGLNLNAGGNIGLNAAVTTGGNLTLSSQGSIAAPSSVSVGGTFQLNSGAWSQLGASLPAFSAHDFQLAGGSFVRALGGDGASSTPYLLTDIYGLQGAGSLSASTSYKLSNNIDASGTSNWSSGFKPLGGIGDAAYNGTFDGNNKVIDSLGINRGGSDYIGLFAVLGNGTIKDLTLNNSTVTGRNNVGGIVGYSMAGGSGLITNVHSAADVSGISNVGGLAGSNGGTLTASSASGTVTGSAGADASNIGGLAGRNLGAISYSSASGAVNATGFGYAGGLVGSNASDGYHTGSISHSYATGRVYSTGEIVGGLVGDNNGGSISIAYSTGDVQGGRNVGGFAGRNINGGSIGNVYSSGNVSGNALNGQYFHANMGGLVGDLYSGSVSNSFSTGQVDGSAFGGNGVHGMVGLLEGGSLVHGYFDADQAGTTSDVAGTPLTTAQTMRKDSFGGFDFDSGRLWRIYEGHTVPLLRDFLTPYTVTVTGGTDVVKTYDGQTTAYTGTIGTLPAGIGGSDNLGYQGAVNAGSYTVGGLYSTVYDISYAGSSGSLTINPRVVTATASVSKVYDGSTSYEGSLSTFTFSNVVAADAGTLGLNAGIQFDNKNVGSHKDITVTGAALTGNVHGNYTLGTVTSDGNASITKASLSLTGLSADSRQYNATNIASLSGTPAISSAIGNDVVTLAGNPGTTAATFADKNVGEGKLVTVNLAGYSLSGTDAGNYQLVAPNLHASISAAPLTVSGVTANSRVYNASTVATLSGGTLSGVLGGDTVSATGGYGYFGNKNAGTGKAVTATSITLGGADAGNYTVSVLPTGLSANITPATLTITGMSANSREYNNTTVATLSGGSLSGVLSYGEGGFDSVTLVNGSGAFADKNIGTAKPVSLSGYTLSGSDAGNYQLVTPTNLSADITARPLSTWTGNGNTTLWSDAGNWADGIAPDGANVLAALLGKGSGTVSYDVTAGSTTLKTLVVDGQSLAISGGTLTLTGTDNDMSHVGGGTLALSGGSLNVAGTLSASSLNQSGGVLGGAGQLNATQYSMSGGSGGVHTQTASTFTQSGGTVSGVAGSFTVYQLAQSGGSIDIDGALTVGNGNNLSVGNIRAQTSITLNANEGGAITQTGALVSDHLYASATNGITLTNTGNHVGSFAATNSGNNSSNPGIALTNTVSSGELALGPLSSNYGAIVIDNHGGIHTTGDIASLHGAVSITAHSPITINNEVSGTDIGLSASTEITLNGNSVLSADNSIGMSAGTGIQLGGALTVLPTGSISALAATGGISASAGTLISSGGAPVTLSAPQGSINTPASVFAGGTHPVLNDGAAAAAAAAAAKAAADAAAAKAAADAAAKAGADAAAKAAADAAAKAAADAAAKAAADAAAKAAADAAAQAAADAAAKAAADALAKAAADAAAKAAADAAAKAAADAAAQAAADAAAKAAADAAAAAAALAAQGGQAQPVGQAINSTVNIINASTSTATPGSNKNAVSVPVDSTTVIATSTGATGKDDKAADGKKDDKKEEAGASGLLLAKKDEQAKKMYCN